MVLPLFALHFVTLDQSGEPMSHLGLQLAQ